MSAKKLGGLTKKLGSKRFNLPGGKLLGIGAALSGIPGLQQQAMHSTDVLDARAGSSGTSSAEREERLTGEAAAQTERERVQSVADEAARKQAEIDAQNAQDEEARKKLRGAQGGGYAANVLAGKQNFGYGDGALRRLSGS